MRLDHNLKNNLTENIDNIHLQNQKMDREKELNLLIEYIYNHLYYILPYLPNGSALYKRNRLTN